MAQLPLLLADIGFWIKLGIFAVFFIAPLLGQIKKGLAGEEKQRGGARDPRQGQQPARAAARPGGQGRDALEAEIEDFLRQAGGGQGAPRAAGPAARPTAQNEPRQTQQPLGQQPLRTQPPRRPQQRRRQSSPRPVEAKVVPQPRRGESVREHVQQHISSHPVSEHGKQLGREVANSDETLEARLHQVFDHEVGKITQEVGGEIIEDTDRDIWDGSTSREPNLALRNMKIIDMLRNPETVRHAVVLHEILKRPDF